MRKHKKDRERWYVERTLRSFPELPVDCLEGFESPDKLLHSAGITVGIGVSDVHASDENDTSAAQHSESVALLAR